ncbi:unnamed protein product, partial [Acidithrix sp. C25]
VTHECKVTVFAASKAISGATPTILINRLLCMGGNITPVSGDSIVAKSSSTQSLRRR